MAYSAMSLDKFGELAVFLIGESMFSTCGGRTEGLVGVCSKGGFEGSFTSSSSGGVVDVVSSSKTNVNN